MNRLLLFQLLIVPVLALVFIHSVKQWVEKRGRWRVLPVILSIAALLALGWWISPTP